MQEQGELTYMPNSKIPAWDDIPHQVKEAMATILVYMKRNGLSSYHLCDDGGNNFHKRKTEEEYLATQEYHKIVRQSWESDFPKRSKAGYVYLVASETGQYKIGRTLRLDQRINTFGVKLPFKTWLSHSFMSDDYKRAEKMLHDKYAEKRTHGEWFKLEPTDVEYIKGIQDGQL